MYTCMWEIASTYKNDNLELQLIPEKKCVLFMFLRGWLIKGGIFSNS